MKNKFKNVDKLQLMFTEQELVNKLDFNSIIDKFKNRTLIQRRLPL